MTDSVKEEKIRWNLLLKTLKNEISQLSSIPYESLSSRGSMEQDGAKDVLQGCGNMVSDLLDLVNDAQKRRVVERKKKESQVSSSRDVTRGPLDVPLPPLIASWRRIDAELLASQSSIDQLTSKNSVKTHRSLLEQREILLAQRARVQRQLEATRAQTRDLVSVGPVKDIYRVALSIAATCPSVQDFAKFFRNVLIHAVILSIIEASFEENRKGKVSLIVDKILDMCLLARNDHSSSQSVEEVKRVLGEVFEHPAISRLPIDRLLDKTTLAKYNKRTGDVEGKVKEAKPTRDLDTGLVEHWILSQTWVSDEELMVDSFALQPKTALEALELSKESHDDIPQADQSTSETNGSSNSINNERGTEAVNLESAGSEKIDSSAGSHDGCQSQTGAQSDEYDLEFPSVPTNVVARHHSELQTSEEADDEIDEFEAQRLMTLFAPSNRSSSDAEDDEPDYSEIVDLTPAEQEEVLKALASAREHHVGYSGNKWTEEENVEELMKQAKAAMKDFDLDTEDEVINKSGTFENDHKSETDSVD